MTDDQEDPGTLASARTSDELASGSGAPEPDQDAPAAKARKKKSFGRELLTIVVAAAVLTLLVKAFVIQVYRIPSASMENTLQIGDRVLVNKVVYHVRGIARGDVVVFSGQDSWGPDAPPPSGNPVVRVADDVLSGLGLHSDQTYYIKRVIGLPGDRVACCTDGKVTVNGVPLNEGQYLFPGNPPSTFKFSVVVPSGHLWVMGDHRSDSDDSRYHPGGRSGRDPRGPRAPAPPPPSALGPVRRSSTSGRYPRSVTPLKPWLMAAVRPHPGHESELPTLWHRPCQIIKRGCRFHVVPAT